MSLRDSNINKLREQEVYLPTAAQLADPSSIPANIIERLKEIDPDTPHPLNLFRVHWNNAADRTSRAETPLYLELPQSLTGVPARIVLMQGDAASSR